MHGNRVKEQLNAGGIATVIRGHKLTSDTIDFLGPQEFDGFWLEGEHGDVVWSEIGDLTRACDLWGKSSLMRVQANDIGIITRTLDNGASGIVVPHVNTISDAEKVVQAARFSPDGVRGVYSGRRSYGSSDFYDRANEDTLLVVLIEEVQAVENLSEILTVDQIDVFFVAPGDLAQSMGLLGQQGNQEVQSLVDYALSKIVAAGRCAGAMGFEPMLEHYIGLGVKMLLANYDDWLNSGAKRYASRIQTLSAS